MPRRYSDEEKQAALAVFQVVGTIAGTARETGVSRRTVGLWVAAADELAKAKARDVVPDTIVDRIERIAGRFLERLEEHGDEISIKQLAIPTAIMLDKLRLFRDDAPRDLLAQMSADAIAGEIEQILKNARARAVLTATNEGDDDGEA